MAWWLAISRGCALELELTAVKALTETAKRTNALKTTRSFEDILLLKVDV
jgi:hypothetical protein